MHSKINTLSLFVAVDSSKWNEKSVWELILTYSDIANRMHVGRRDVRFLDVNKVGTIQAIAVVSTVKVVHEKRFRLIHLSSITNR